MERGSGKERGWEKERDLEKRAWSAHHSMMKLAQDEETSNLPKIISMPAVFH